MRRSLEPSLLLLIGQNSLTKTFCDFLIAYCFPLCSEASLVPSRLLRLSGTRASSASPPPPVPVCLVSIDSQSPGTEIVVKLRNVRMLFLSMILRERRLCACSLDHNIREEE